MICPIMSKPNVIEGKMLPGDPVPIDCQEEDCAIYLAGDCAVLIIAKHLACLQWITR